MILCGNLERNNRVQGFFADRRELAKKPCSRETAVRKKESKHESIAEIPHEPNRLYPEYSCGPQRWCDKKQKSVGCQAANVTQFVYLKAFGSWFLACPVRARVGSAVLVPGSTGCDLQDKDDRRERLQ